MTVLDIQTPRVFAPLLRPARYKGAHGGRGSGKSHFFAESLIEKALMEPGLRAVCIREIQKSLEQSVMRLLEDKIQALGVASKFDVLKTEIRTPGDGLIIFQGMQNHTADSIKSLQGYKVAWVEEAHSLSKRSLTLLRPTIREPDSELWFSWNPESPEDPVDAMFRGPERLDDGDVICVEANWRDNPWFPDVLDAERRRDFTRDPDGYGHVWEGGYVTISDAIIFRRRVVVEEFAPPPPDTHIRFGADWGFSQDPTTLVRFWIQPVGDEADLMIEHEAGGVGVELDETAALFDQVPGSRDWPIWADSARPETISYMRRQGFSIAAAEKWPGSVEDGVAHLKAFRRIVVHPRCVETAREFRLYAYKVDRLTGRVLPLIVDAYNHRIDALRYGLNGFIQRRGAAGIWSRLV